MKSSREDFYFLRKSTIIWGLIFSTICIFSFLGYSVNAEKVETENALMANLSLVISIRQDGGVREPSNSVGDTLNGVNYMSK